MNRTILLILVIVVGAGALIYWRMFSGPSGKTLEQLGRAVVALNCETDFFARLEQEDSLIRQEQVALPPPSQRTLAKGLEVANHQLRAIRMTLDEFRPFLTNAGIEPGSLGSLSKLRPTEFNSLKDKIASDVIVTCPGKIGQKQLLLDELEILLRAGAKTKL
ncbi:MAG TPA: hypothetical protein VEL48_11390 [Candidatus Acidoferrales bacterium]|nr:hypothetical protein [Candidatus Acidoferrales bacterium]